MSCLSILLQHFQMIANNFIFVFVLYCVILFMCSFLTWFTHKYQVTFANANIYFHGNSFFVFFSLSFCFDYFLYLIPVRSLCVCVFFVVCFFFTFQGDWASEKESERENGLKVIYVCSGLNKRNVKEFWTNQNQREKRQNHDISFFITHTEREA